MQVLLRRKVSIGVILVLLLAIVAGCGSVASPEDSLTGQENAGSNSASSSGEEGVAGSTSYPLTIVNHALSGEGGTWTAKEQRFEQSPEKVVANTQPAAELLIRLGLTEKMVGVAALYGEVAPDIADEFATIPVLSKDYVGKELVLGANPDLVLGRGDLFADADWGVGTVDALNELSIKTFVQNTSVKGADLESLFQDIEQIGQIFDIQERATQYAEDLRKRVETIKSITPAAEKPVSFAYISSSEKGAVAVYSGANDTFQADALRLLNLENSFGEADGEVGVEQLISTNPDILLISYYSGGPDTEEMVNHLYDNPALQSMSAIKDKKIFIIDFNQFWGYGDQIFDGVEKLGGQLY
ncbi:ABC transporter substrate-binding protein [Paenibacillus senegalimassiliensis]|uniref:ABC transporter substrate-binding protein n=1 Tax=Paenibacillus senegalimassiliensis TaxID=1737426 RepID=UPI00073E404B|nr:ABC transporter substrate-binding protein [Paenibacillus senegalimassiliensis]